MIQLRDPDPLSRESGVSRGTSYNSVRDSSKLVAVALREVEAQCSYKNERTRCCTQCTKRAGTVIASDARGPEGRPEAESQKTWRLTGSSRGTHPRPWVLQIRRGAVPYSVLHTTISAPATIC
jgi:hypothetical protein